MQICGCLLLPKVLRGTTGPRPNHEVDETWLHPLLSFSPPTCPPVPTLLTHHSGSSRCFPGGSCYFLLPKPSLTISFSCLKNDQWLPKRNQTIKTFLLSFQILLSTAPSNVLLQVDRPPCPFYSHAFSMLLFLLPKLASASHLHLWKSLTCTSSKCLP